MARNEAATGRVATEPAADAPPSSLAPSSVDAPLSRRLLILTGGRLVLIVVALTLVSFVYVRRSQRGLDAYTVQVALATGCAAMVLTVVYLFLLRRGRRLEELAAVQIVLDQAVWSIVVYLTGGAASGATSLYGITCVAGSLLLGLPGATTAALSGGVFFLLLISLLQSQALPWPPDQSPANYQLTPDETTYYVVVNLLVLVVVALLSGYLAERLRRAGGQLVLAEERAAQAERMAALGRLAAGLAHEIRNPLSSISGSIQLLEGAPGLGPEDRVLCKLISREADRLEELVNDMVDLARPRKPAFRTLDACAVAREVVLLAGQRGRGATDVSIVFVDPGQPVYVRADDQQLRQLVWNLVRNAVQASTAGDEVRVRVEPGAQARLVVEDDGKGIDPASRDKLFDAFFTTRSQGTGVGLAVVKRIADEHGFAIEVDAGRPRGAAFALDMGHPLENSRDPGDVSPNIS